MSKSNTGDEASSGSRSVLTESDLAAIYAMANMKFDEDEIIAMVNEMAYVPLATPENLARDLATQVHDLPPENVGGFINVCLLTAVTGRRTVVEDYLKKPKRSALVRFIRKHFYYQDRLTFSQLNLICLCLLAVSGETTDAFANANFRSTRALISDFRLRLGGAKSIWDADIGATRFSKERKRILKEQKDKFSAQIVAENGAAIVQILNDKYQSGIKA